MQELSDFALPYGVTQGLYRPVPIFREALSGVLGSAHIPTKLGGRHMPCMLGDCSRSLRPSTVIGPETSFPQRCPGMVG